MVSESLSDCPFCAIAANYPEFPPTSLLPLDPELVSPAAFVVLSSEKVMAFLDIMPLSEGHLLVTTRRHHEKISDVDDEQARELGYWLPVLSRVLGNVTGVFDWNIVQNNVCFGVMLLISGISVF
jgi:diadenosine tetraphosphate (Ap4A) HIT family hydrolase